MSGYFRAPREAWPAIAETLPKPWREEWVELDCAYWANEFRRLEMGISSAVPGRGKRQKLTRKDYRTRWGWSDHHTRRALQQYDPMGIKDSPEILQDSSRIPPGLASGNANNGEIISRTSQLTIQSESTRADLKKKEEGRRKKITQCIWGLWTTRKATHPAGAPQGEALTKACRQAIDKALKQYTVEDLILVARWAFESPGYHAAHLRGDHPGQTQNAYLSARSFYRPTKIDDKIHHAKCWRDTGSPVGTSAAGPKIDGEAAWLIVIDRVKRHGSKGPTSPWRKTWTYAEDDPALDAAIRKAVKSAFGSWSGLGDSNPRFNKKQFLQAFNRGTE